MIQFYTISQPVIHSRDKGFFAECMAYFYEKLTNEKFRKQFKLTLHKQVCEVHPVYNFQMYAAVFGGIATWHRM
jgi:hypothetical protein